MGMIKTSSEPAMFSKEKTVPSRLQGVSGKEEWSSETCHFEFFFISFEVPLQGIGQERESVRSVSTF